MADGTSTALMGGEERIAGLAALGRRNTEIAEIARARDELEGGRMEPDAAYRKLGVSSRTELAVHFNSEGHS